MTFVFAILWTDLSSRVALNYIMFKQSVIVQVSVTFLKIVRFPYEAALLHIKDDLFLGGLDLR